MTAPTQAMALAAEYDAGVWGARGVGEAEWRLRQDLAALYRAVHRYGMSDLIYNHITARVPGEDDAILLNPYGLLYTEVTASNLFKIRLDGEIVYEPGIGLDLNPAAYVIHTAVHAARHDLQCVLHVHTRASTAVSAMECGLLPLSQQACLFHGRIAYHDFSGPEVLLSQQAQLVQDLGDRHVAILRNHGLLVGGRTIAEAFFHLYWLESACRIQVDAMAAGQLRQADAAAVQSTREAFARVPIRGDREWAAIRREMDRLDPGYRD